MLAFAPAAHASYDDLNGETLGDTPYTAATPFVAPVQSFNNAAFGAEPEYTAPASYAGCQAWGARSAWVRFATAVQGRVFVTVDTAYDVFYMVYTAPTTIPPGSASLGQLNWVDCHNSRKGLPNEDYTFGHAIPAGQMIYVQVMSVCANRTTTPECTPQERQVDAPGGLTDLRVRFTPDNTDGDALPDTLDACPATPGPAGGCPDPDGDGVGDPADACPEVRGKRADGCRLPDEDADGYAADAADPRVRDCDDDRAGVNPGRPELRGNDLDEDCDGLAAFDRDGDDWDDAPGRDCDPTDPRIHPRARDKPGNGVDEDCNGRDARFPRVTSEVAPSYLVVRGRTVGFAQFGILPVRKGMRVRIECAGRGCPYSAREQRVGKSRAQLVVGKEFRSRILAPGGSVTVKVMRQGHVGRVLRFTLRAQPGKPRIEKLCLAPGTTRPERKRCR